MTTSILAKCAALANKAKVAKTQMKVQLILKTKDVVLIRRIQINAVNLTMMISIQTRCAVLASVR